MITEIPAGAKCTYKNCELPATGIAAGREELDKGSGHPNPALYCDSHADVVANEDWPEYVTDCPNCGCWFGVG